MVGITQRFLSLGDQGLWTPHLLLRSQAVLTAEWLWPLGGHWDTGCVTKLKTKNKLPRSARSKQLTLDFGHNIRAEKQIDKYIFTAIPVLLNNFLCSVSVVTTLVTPAWLSGYCVTPWSLSDSRPRYLWCKLYSEQGLVMSCKCSLSHFLYRHIILDKTKCDSR